jgi:hypothetical protein
VSQQDPTDKETTERKANINDDEVASSLVLDKRGARQLVEYDEGPAGVVERRGRGAEIESKKYAQKRAQIFSSRPENDPLPPERGVKSGEETQVVLGKRTMVKEVEAGIIDYALRRRFHPAFLLSESRQQSESRPRPLSQFDWSLQLPLPPLHHHN